MPSELTTVEKYMLAQLLVCGEVNEKEFERITDIPQHGTGVREQTLDRLRQKGALQQTLYQG
jgi:hypothetical protein